MITFWSSDIARALGVQYILQQQKAVLHVYIPKLWDVNKTSNCKSSTTGAGTLLILMKFLFSVLVFWLNNIWSLETCKGICLLQGFWSQYIFHTLCSCFRQVSVKHLFFFFHTAHTVPASRLGFDANSGTQVQQYLTRKNNIKLSGSPSHNICTIF